MLIQNDQLIGGQLNKNELPWEGARREYKTQTGFKLNEVYKNFMQLDIERRAYITRIFIGRQTNVITYIIALLEFKDINDVTDHLGIYMPRKPMPSVARILEQYINKIDVNKRIYVVNTKNATVHADEPNNNINQSRPAGLPNKWTYRRITKSRVHCKGRFCYTRKEKGVA